jgi:hypothetical protein
MGRKARFLMIEILLGSFRAGLSCLRDYFKKSAFNRHSKFQFKNNARFYELTAGGLFLQALRLADRSRCYFKSVAYAPFNL